MKWVPMKYRQKGVNIKFITWFLNKWPQKIIICDLS
jgi:hypothetical protein